MDRAKIVFIAIAVVAVGAAAALGFVAKGKFDAAREAEDDARSAYSKLDKIYKEEIFPSRENVDVMKGVVAGLEESRSAITGALANCNVPMVAGTTPSSFVQTLGTAIKALVEKAPIVDGVKSVSPNFAFGFDAYVGSNPAMPQESEVPLLSQQLVLVNRLVFAMYGAQVSQVVSIRRDAQDQATLNRAAAASADAQAGRGRRGRRGRGADVEEDSESESAPKAVKKGKSKEKKGGAGEPAAPLFSSQQMTVEFTARQSALVDFLNRVASMKAFVVVTDMSVKKTASDIRLPEGAVAAADSSAAGEQQQGRRGSSRRASARASENVEPEVAAQPDKLSELPPEMRVMTGPDVDPPLLVRLELDVYSFGKEGE